MLAVFYASLAIIPWVAFTLLLRFLIEMKGLPVGLVGTFSRMVTIPLLAAWVLGTGSGWRRLRPRGMGGWLALMGGVSIAVNLLWFASMHWTTATNVSMLFRLDVLFVVLLGSLLGLERIGLAQLALLPIMLAGLALLTEFDEFDWNGHLVGDVMIVVAAFGLATNAFVIRHIMRVMDEESVALYNHSISALGFVTLGLVTGTFAGSRQVFAEAVLWQSIVALGIIASVGLPLYYVALRRMSVWKLRMLMLSAPVFTAAVEWPLWGGQLSGLQCLGATIVMGGLAALIGIEWRQNSVRHRSHGRTAA